MKFLNTKTALIVLFSVFSLAINAQEIIKEKVSDSTKVKLPTSRQKVDGIIATVGDYIILDSDIDKGYLEISSQGNAIKDITRCQMLGKLLEDKLYAHQAIQDSIVVKDDEVKKMMDDQINYMVEQVGTLDKVIQYYKKNSEEEFRTYYFDIIKENKLAAEMQKLQGVKDGPEIVRDLRAENERLRSEINELRQKVENR